MGNTKIAHPLVLVHC